MENAQQAMTKTDTAARTKYFIIFIFSFLLYTFITEYGALYCPTGDNHGITGTATVM